ncbi:toll/interleukin-1 receptor domain-containing protein [Lysinibacillus xylanilyticus]|uniref:toll/interleukin-1 receptor domain-containing protein n=1 Tax=Lysinibacillus xylanilyticus TaxID=582475 RepID=UPI003CFC79C4
MTSKIVISHATVDKPLVEAFIDFLRLGLSLDRKDIYCTSISGTIPTGVKFVDHIKEHIEGAQLVPLLLTENYFKSKFCLAEMGAVWMINKNIYPIIIPPLNHTAIEDTPLKGMQIRYIKSFEDLLGIGDEFHALGVLDDVPISTLVSKESKKFFKNYEEILDEIKIVEKATVSQEDYNTIVSDNERLLNLIDVKIEEIDSLKEFVEKIKQAKDKQEIAEIEMADAPIWEQFEEHVENVKFSIRGLDKIIQSALFYDVRGEEFWPPYGVYTEEIKNLASREKIFEDYGGNGITVNERFPDIRAAIEKINILERFIANNNDLLEETFESNYSVPLIFKSADFWEELLRANIVISER